MIKADGLALGKGVVVCDTASDAERALAACLDEGRFGDAGTTVVVEERLAGPEVSVFGLCDGTRLRMLHTARDHKRLQDGDRGPNTGGMGAVSPSPDVDDALLDATITAVLQPCVDALKDRGTSFVGCLYAGLMLTDAGPRVLEFNARFGDPEAQVLLPLLDESALELLVACARGRLEPGRAARVRVGGSQYRGLQTAPITQPKGLVFVVLARQSSIDVAGRHEPDGQCPGCHAPGRQAPAGHSDFCVAASLANRSAMIRWTLPWVYPVMAAISGGA